MKRSVFVLLIFKLIILVPSQAAAQNPSLPYLLPQTIFVGDSGRLVVPLGQGYTGIAPFVLDRPDRLPGAADFVIRKIELEHRSGSPRLLIDFIPYAPGLLSFPPIELISPGAEASGIKNAEEAPPAITGLQVQVASILSPSNMALSQPASPLAVPGTSLLIYGTLALIIAILFFGIGGSLWGRRHFREIWERFRRRYLLRGMRRFMARLKQECNLDKNNPGRYLSLLSGEFREFLSHFTGMDCRPLTSGEFLDLPLSYTDYEQEDKALLSPVFLCRLFRTWDTLRFSGRLIDRVDMFFALSETESFLNALDKAEREKPLPKTIASPLREPVS